MYFIYFLRPDIFDWRIVSASFPSITPQRHAMIEQTLFLNELLIFRVKYWSGILLCWKKIGRSQRRLLYIHIPTTRSQPAYMYVSHGWFRISACRLCFECIYKIWLEMSKKFCYFWNMMSSQNDWLWCCLRAHFAYHNNSSINFWDELWNCCDISNLQAKVHSFGLY